MGVWGHRAFDNDAACDWVYDLEKTSDLSLVEQALTAVENSGDGYVNEDLAVEALAACEVLARLLGRPGYSDAYTENVDRWVAANPQRPNPILVTRAASVIDRVLGDDSEIADLWNDEDQSLWRESVEDLKRRLTESV